MASNDDKVLIDNTDIPPTTAAEVSGETAAPVKKTPAKRAPRKATKKASAPQQATLTELTD